MTLEEVGPKKGSRTEPSFSVTSLDALALLDVFEKPNSLHKGLYPLAKKTVYKS